MCHICSFILNWSTFILCRGIWMKCTCLSRYLPKRIYWVLVMVSNVKRRSGCRFEIRKSWLIKCLPSLDWYVFMCLLFLLCVCLLVFVLCVCLLVFLFLCFAYFFFTWFFFLFFSDFFLILFVFLCSGFVWFLFLLCTFPSDIYMACVHVKPDLCIYKTKQSQNNLNNCIGVVTTIIQVWCCHYLTQTHGFYIIW